jgi:formylglycine-generating enzyme
VTAGQYTEFLTAVAKTDTYGLYNAQMWSDIYGCKIQQSGTPGDYAYSVAADYANRPVNYVGYWDACRFANWLHNDRPTFAAGTPGEVAGSTETGAYTLTTDGISNNTVFRNADWRFAVTSEDEWYKAAYYKGGSLNCGYWRYPTSSDTEPGGDITDASGNNANCRDGATGNPSPFPIDPPYYFTLAGEFQASDSPYGTFDQGGNVSEWNEAIISSSSRGIRGGRFDNSIRDTMQAYYRGDYRSPTIETSGVGFRVVSVPEPGSLGMSAGIALTALLWHWRRRA